MTHQYLDKKQIIRRKKITRNIIGFGIFFILAAIGGMSFFGGVFNFVGNPVWKIENGIKKGFNNVGYLFQTKSSLSKENQNLRDENIGISLSMIDYQILKKENEDLKETLGRLPKENDFILGNILTKPNHSPYDTLIIDIGNDFGVRVGDMVYANGNIPIGNVNKVYEKTSLVSLFSNPGQKTEGFINGVNASIELTGRGGGNFEMIIPMDLSIENGTAIYMPGSTSLVLAKTGEIISTPTDPFKKIILSSPVNIQSLKWVQVIKN